MASKLESKTEEEVFIKQVIIEGVIGVQSGQNPRILEEKLSAFLSNEVKVKANLEQHASLWRRASMRRREIRRSR